jgi:hypothetical protein
MKKYQISQILARADQLGIVLWIANGDIQADGPPGTLTDRFRQTIADHKRELLAVLPAPLCAACLDAGKDTLGTWQGPDELMLCETHRPVQERLPISEQLLRHGRHFE